MDNKYSFEITAFRAVDNLELCKVFVQGHSDLLKEVGISKLTSADTKWCENPNSYVLLIKVKGQDKYIAGARLEIRSDTTKLPLEEAIKEFDVNFEDYVNTLQKKGEVGEICGLWISKSYLGIGLAVILLRADISMALPLKVTTLLFLCSDSTKKMLQRMGCIVETTIGKDGTFYYPKEDLLATLMIIEDVNTLKEATLMDRNRMFSLYKKPNQYFLENAPKDIIEVQYTLGNLVVN